MKAKINFSGDSIKKFFFKNVEKLVLGITVLVLLAFLYSVITAKPLDESKSPEAISRDSRAVDSTLEVPTWNAHKEEMHLVATRFKEQTDESMRPIPGTRV